jgi:hypothetical protein
MFEPTLLCPLIKRLSGVVHSAMAQPENTVHVSGPCGLGFLRSCEAVIPAVVVGAFGGLYLPPWLHRLGESLKQRADFLQCAECHLLELSQEEKEPATDISA